MWPSFPGKVFFDENSMNMIPPIECQNTVLSRHIVMQSDAISAATPYQIESDLNSGLISMIPFTASWMTLNYGFVYVKDRPLSPVALEYMSIVEEVEADVEIKNKAMIKKYLRA